MPTTEIDGFPRARAHASWASHVLLVACFVLVLRASRVCAQTLSSDDPGSEFVLINLKFTGNGWEINTWQDTVSSPEPVLPYLWVALTGRGTVVRIATAGGGKETRLAFLERGRAYNAPTGG